MSENARSKFMMVSGRIIVALVLMLISWTAISYNQIGVSEVSYKPIRIIKDGIEVSGSVPPIIMGNRTYVPDSFIPALFGYPVSWDPKTRSVTIGVPEGGIDFIRRYPAYNGKLFPKPVKIVDDSYIYGYQLTSTDPIRWNLHGIFNTVKFGFGIPNNGKIKEADIVALLDGKIIAQDTVTLGDGLKQFSFDVSNGKVLTLKVNKKEGGVIVGAIGMDVPDEEDPNADKSAMSLNIRLATEPATKKAAEETAADTTADTAADTTAEAAPTTTPLKVILDGVESQSDQPILLRGSRIYVPVRFITESLKYPIEWDNTNRIVYIGAFHLGSDLFAARPPKGGTKYKTSVVIGGVGYPSSIGTAVSGFYSSTIKWENLKKRFQYLTFSFGIPDSSKIKEAGFIVEVNGTRRAGKGSVTKDSGIVEFSIPIKDATAITIYTDKEAGGIIVNPRAQ